MNYGTVSKGHGVASGIGGDHRYPEGTLALQWPFFEEAGIPIQGLFKGTVNVNIAPAAFKILTPSFRIESVDWSKFIPPENFLFFDVTTTWQNAEFKGLIYMPDPATKTDHFQDPHILEMLLPKMSGIKYGDRIGFTCPEQQLNFD